MKNEDISQINEKLQSNIYKLLLSDMNSKCGKETHLMPMIGKESIHEKTNGNGLRLISFAAAKDMIIKNAILTHETIHKATWKSPDGSNCNQIGHIILIQKRFHA